MRQREVHPRELLEAWTVAERSLDVSALDAILADDFLGFAHSGMMLDKEQWLDRLDRREIVYETLTLERAVLRMHGAVAVAVAVQEQRSEYKGDRIDGCFWNTQVFACWDGGWQVACMHVKPMSSNGHGPAGDVTP